MAVDADASPHGLDGSSIGAVDPDPANGARDVDEPPPDLDRSRKEPGRQRLSAARTAIAVGVVVVVALGSLAGWLGYRTYQSHQTQDDRDLFVAVARQTAANLTTISYTEVDADVQRILEGATGAFLDDFQKRSQPFIDAVKQAQSTTQGSVTAAGLASVDGEHAEVLIAVSVKIHNATATEQVPRAWRMRISVQNTGSGVKASDVQFVP